MREANHLGRALSRARQERRIQQGELARRLRMSAANLSRIEHGADFRVSTLLDLARELGLEPLLVPKRLVPVVESLLSEEEGGVPPERGRFA